MAKPQTKTPEWTVHVSMFIHSWAVTCFSQTFVKMATYTLTRCELTTCWSMTATLVTTITLLGTRTVISLNLRPSEPVLHEGLTSKHEPNQSLPQCTTKEPVYLGKNESLPGTRHFKCCLYPKVYGDQSVSPILPQEVPSRFITLPTPDDLRLVNEKHVSPSTRYIVLVSLIYVAVTHDTMSVGTNTRVCIVP